MTSAVARQAGERPCRARDRGRVCWRQGQRLLRDNAGASSRCAQATQPLGRQPSAPALKARDCPNEVIPAAPDCADSSTAIMPILTDRRRTAPQRMSEWEQEVGLACTAACILLPRQPARRWRCWITVPGPPIPDSSGSSGMTPPLRNASLVGRSAGFRSSSERATGARSGAAPPQANTPGAWPARSETVRSMPSQLPRLEAHLRKGSTDLGPRIGRR